MKVFITGSEGFIGSHLTEKLVEKGHDVKAFVMYNFNNSNGWLDDLNKNIKNNIKISKGDIRDFDTLKKDLLYAPQSPRNWLQQEMEHL